MQRLARGTEMACVGSREVKATQRIHSQKHPQLQMLEAAAEIITTHSEVSDEKYSSSLTGCKHVGEKVVGPCVHGQCLVP